MEVNEQYFSKEQVEAGEMSEFINLLTKQCYGVGTCYNDIHIRVEDCGAFIVEWAVLPWDHTYGGNFKYVDEDEIVMIERQLPDGTYNYFRDEDDYNETLAEWLKDNPGWEKNQYGHWYNVEEQKKWEEYIKAEEPICKVETNDDELVDEKTFWEEDTPIIGAEHLENGIPQGK